MSDARKIVMIDYTNHAGVRSWRKITPISISFENNEWHPDSQWLLTAYDHDRDDLRYFAVSGIHRWKRSG